MRRWVIVAALLANALLSGLVLLKLWADAGWDTAAQLSSAEVDLLIVVALVALALDLVLVPVLGISFWARDRGTRRLQAQVASLAAAQPPVAVPPAPGGPAGGAADAEAERGPDA
jgi:hypothetical protein